MRAIFNLCGRSPVAYPSAIVQPRRLISASLALRSASPRLGCRKSLRIVSPSRFALTITVSARTRSTPITKLPGGQGRALTRSRLRRVSGSNPVAPNVRFSRSQHHDPGRSKHASRLNSAERFRPDDRCNREASKRGDSITVSNPTPLNRGRLTQFHGSRASAISQGQGEENG